jgi:hypothetical protein
MGNVEANLPPAVQPGDTPELYRLHSKTFEKLCRDLFALEPDITSADLWGTPGQSQDGVDIIASHRRRRDRGGPVQGIRGL